MSVLPGSNFTWNWQISESKDISAVSRHCARAREDVHLSQLHVAYEGVLEQVLKSLKIPTNVNNASPPAARSGMTDL